MLQPIRVLHFLPALGIGGLETCLARILKCMRPRVECGVFVYVSGGTLEKEVLALSVPIFRADQPDLSSRARRFSRLIRAIREFRPDVVHTYMEAPSSTAILANTLARTGARMVVQWVGGDPSLRRGSPPYWLHRVLLPRADGVISCSEAVEACYLEHYPTGGRMLRRVIHYGVPLDEFDAQMDRPPFSIREKWGIESDRALFAFVGRLVDYKGVDVLLSAMSQLGEEGASRAHLLVIGDGPEDTALQAQARTLGLPNVTFCGAQPPDAIAGLLAQTDILAHPAKSEALGGSILEAMAARRPVLATRVGGIPEAVADGVSGLLVPSDDAAALAQGLKWMLDHPAERQGMGQAGRRIIEERFTMQVSADRAIQVYREILGRAEAPL
jgi:glycosyltransferase involved in cell wall biosynthesis